MPPQAEAIARITAIPAMSRASANDMEESLASRGSSRRSPHPTYDTVGGRPWFRAGCPHDKITLCHHLDAAWSPEHPGTSAAGSCPSCLPGPSGPLHGARPWQAARPAVVRRGGDGRRGRAGRGGRGAALAGVDVAYYLIHSLGSASGFERRDRVAAEIFARAAAAAGVGRIIYLGGIVPAADALGLVTASSVAGRGRGHPAGERGADGRASGCRDHRERLCFVRDAPLPDRATACHGHAALGQDPDPADRGPGRAPLPGRLPRACRPRSAGASTSAVPTS